MRFTRHSTPCTHSIVNCHLYCPYCAAEAFMGLSVCTVLLYPWLITARHSTAQTERNSNISVDKYRQSDRQADGRDTTIPQTQLNSTAPPYHHALHALAGHHIPSFLPLSSHSIPTLTAPNHLSTHARTHAVYPDKTPSLPYQDHRLYHLYCMSPSSVHPPPSTVSQARELSQPKTRKRNYPPTNTNA